METRQAENDRFPTDNEEQRLFFDAENESAGDAAGESREENAHARTKAFSERLNRMSRRAVDDFIAGLSLTDPETGEKIQTREACEAYFGAHPLSGTEGEENNRLRQELLRLKTQEQDALLKKDPEKAPIYQSVREKVLALVENAHANGHPEVDVESAFAAVLQQEYGSILKQIEEAAQETAVRRMTDASRASVGKLGGGDTPSKPDYASMSDGEFEKQLALARRGALRAK